MSGTTAQEAKRTELLLGVILGLMLLGLAVLARRWHIAPRSGQTAQIMAMAVGRNWAYFAVTFALIVVLALAANTSFGSLPVLASLLARDNYLPHVFALRDDRQVFAPGIGALGRVTDEQVSDLSYVSADGVLPAATAPSPQVGSVPR